MSHTPFGSSGIAFLERLFNSSTVPGTGDFFTVSTVGYNLDDPFAGVSGVSQRLIVDLADLTSSRAVNSTGQVEHLFHPHREDQLDLWSRVEYHPVLVSRDAVKADAEATLRLLPGPGI
jgi:penicillin amidase